MPTNRSAIESSTRVAGSAAAASRPKILVNTTVINKGGALQNSSMFILQALRDPQDFDWHFALSSAVKTELRRLDAELPEDTVVFDSSPARNKPARRRLAELAASHRPDLVFTFAGPAYVRFNVLHLLGCNEGWVTHAGWTAYRSLRFPHQWLSFAMASLYKLWWFRAADAWVMQTETSRRGLHRRARVPLEDCYIVPNTCGDHYRSTAEPRPFPNSVARVRLLSFAAPYPHKNLDLIPHVAFELSRRMPQLDFEFLLTLPEDHPQWAAIQADASPRGVRARLKNIGPVAVADGPALYRSCDICFLPTVHETFSATHAEAMAMGLPIVTTDLPFARDACQDAALYFPPRNAAQAADQLQKLLTSESEWTRLVTRGRQIAAQLPTAAERYQRFLDVIRSVLAKHPAMQPLSPDRFASQSGRKRPGGPTGNSRERFDS